MKKTLIIVLFVLMTSCLFLTTGCMNTFGTDKSADVVSAVKHPNDSSNTNLVKFVHVNGITIGYREFGSGEPILMVTGFGNTISDCNQTFIDILASKYHVFVYDHRGMGNSTDNNETPTISLYADDAAQLIRALGYDSMNIYGVSMGSSISQQLVLDHPERVNKLILDSVSYSIRIPETKMLKGIIESAAIDSNISKGIREEAEANLAWNGTYGGLSGIQKDVMLVVGTDDVLTPEMVAVQMAGQINGSWLVRFKGLPHVGSHYAPVQYGELALTFLGMDESP